MTAAVGAWPSRPRGAHGPPAHSTTLHCRRYGARIHWHDVTRHCPSEAADCRNTHGRAIFGSMVVLLLLHGAWSSHRCLQIAALDLGSSFVFEYVICMVSKSRVDLTNLSFDHPTVQSLEKNRSEKVARQTFMGSDRLPGRAARVMPVRDTMCTLYLFCGFGSNSLYLSVLLCTAVVGELLYEWRAAVWARR